MIHELKTWPAPFALVASGAKTHEIRKTDRPYTAGDELHLREWVPTCPTGCSTTDGACPCCGRFGDEPTRGSYSGRTCDVLVTFVTWGGEWGIPKGLCVMSIRLAKAGGVE